MYTKTYTCYRARLTTNSERFFTYLKIQLNVVLIFITNKFRFASKNTVVSLDPIAPSLVAWAKASCAWNSAKYEQPILFFLLYQVVYCAVRGQESLLDSRYEWFLVFRTHCDTETVNMLKMCVLGIKLFGNKFIKIS